MPHDRAFLDKCEAFLLHPAVRALSLAQRVDFLEQKGLSPEEVTTCLKAVETQNGLSTLLAPAAAAAAVDSAANALVAKQPATPTWRTAVLIFVKRYGIVALLTLLLGYGYVRFRQRALEQLTLQQTSDRMKRRTRRATNVERMLTLISEQQSQYKQAAMLLEQRVATIHAAQRTAAAAVPIKVAATGACASELTALRHELRTLQGAVIQTLVQSTAGRDQQAAESSTEAPRVESPTSLLSAALTATTQRQSAGNSVTFALSNTSSNALHASASSSTSSNKLKLSLTPREVDAGARNASMKRAAGSDELDAHARSSSTAQAPAAALVS